MGTQAAAAALVGAVAPAGGLAFGIAAADDLDHQAVALEARREVVEALAPTPDTPAEPPMVAAITDAAESLDAALPPPDLAAISAAAARAEADRIAERLATLDAAIRRHIEEWVGTELPQLVSRELDDLAERLQATAAAHLRATVLPLIASEIADTIPPGPEA